MGRQEKMTLAKSKIVQSLEEMLYRQDLDEIYVSDIIRMSGVSRKTFYRNFKDKYDLMNCYFLVIYEDTFGRITDEDAWNEALYRYLAACEEKAQALLHAYLRSMVSRFRKKRRLSLAV